MTLSGVFRQHPPPLLGPSRRAQERSTLDSPRDLTLKRLESIILCLYLNKLLATPLSTLIMTSRDIVILYLTLYRDTLTTSCYRITWRRQHLRRKWSFGLNRGPMTQQVWHDKVPSLPPQRPYVKGYEMFKFFLATCTSVLSFKIQS